MARWYLLMMPLCVCFSSGQIHSVPVFRSAYLWVSSCLMLRDEKGAMGYWHGQHLYLMALMISEPTVVATSSEPFVLLPIKKASSEKSSIDSYSVGVCSAGKDGTLGLQMVKCLCIHAPTSTHFVLQLILYEELSGAGLGKRAGKYGD